MESKKDKAYYHLPGLFEYYELYKRFLPIFRDHRDYFYDWCEIGSIYGAPKDCIWNGGRVGFGDNNAKEVLSLMKEYNISARLTFSNSLINKEHIDDTKCNKLCKLFNDYNGNGVIIYSDMLLDYIKSNYPNLYFVSSTTKVITNFNDLINELDRKEYKYVVPDFRINKQIDELLKLTFEEKSKVEFLCNECCDINCTNRKKCYENVSRKNLGEDVEDHICLSPNARLGYKFSLAKLNPSFIGVDDIVNTYLPIGFNNFKIEGRSLGSGIILEFLLYYMVKPEYQLDIREDIYLDSNLDIF